MPEIGTIDGLELTAWGMLRQIRDTTMNVKLRPNPLAGDTVLELSRAILPTAHGDFTIVAFAHAGRQLHDVALVRGEPRPGVPVPVRVHSECLTGDVFGSYRCDCGPQLELALERIAQCEVGVLLYMRQEGRGIGIANKVRAYALQDIGMDTVEANLHLGFDDDLRHYDVAAGMLRTLGVTHVELHTNNPRKVEGLRHAGLEVLRRVSLRVAPSTHNAFYLATKQRRSGHWLGQDDPSET